MKITKKQLADCLYTPTTRDDLDRLNSDARKALLAGTLEIDGYERVPAWIKFDPNYPNTHPPCSVPVFGEPAFYLVRINGQTQIAEWDNDYVAFLIGDCEAITHWRPPPKPPQETEEGK